MTDSKYLEKLADKLLKPHQGTPFEVGLQEAFENSIEVTDTDEIDSAGRPVSHYVCGSDSFVEPFVNPRTYREPTKKSVISAIIHQRPKTARLDLRRGNKGEDKHAIREDYYARLDVL